MFKRFLTNALLLAMAVVSGLAVAQQDTGTLRLTIFNAVTERPVAGAGVTLLRQADGVRVASPDEEGVVTLPVGLYTIQVDAQGYKDVELNSIRVVADKITPVPVPLTPAREIVEEVFITGTQTDIRELSSVGTSAMDREMLRSAAGSGSDVLRALDGLPGLFSDGAFSTYTVRGNGPRDNLILVDGIPFENVVHFRDSFGEDEEVEGGGRYSVFAPNLISSAEFQPGGWRSQYGGKAGSLLKLDVAEGNKESATYTARLDIAGLEVGYDGPSRVFTNTSVLFSARRYDFTNLFEAVGLEDVGSPKLTDMILKTTTDLTDLDSVNFLVIYAPESYTRDIDNVLASDEDDPGNYEDVEVADVDKENTLAAVTWSRLVGDAGKLSNQLYYRYFNEDAVVGEAFPDLVPAGTPASDIPVNFDLQTSARGEQEFGWQLDYENDNPFGRYYTGLRVRQLSLDFSLILKEDWNRFVYTQNDFRPDPNRKFITLTPDLFNTDYEEDASQYIVYFDQTWGLGDIDFRLGSRIEADELSNETYIEPRFGMMWYANPNLNISFNAGRYFQAVALEDRALDPTNRSLKNEQTDQLSVGFKYRLNDTMQLFVEPYYLELNDLAVSQGQVDNVILNVGEGHSYGFDTALTRQFEDGWSADIKYSFNRAKIKENPNAPELDADFNRPHIFSIGAVWEKSDRWKFSGRWKWASGKPADEFIIHDNVLGDGQPLRFSKEITAENTQRFDSFNSLNVRIDYRRAIAGFDVIAFLDVINVLGADNPNSNDFNERVGRDEVEEGESLPIIGFRVAW